MCIESIQAQQTSFPFSVIYVDDASGYTEEEIDQLETILQKVKGELVVLPSRHYQIGSIAQAVPKIKTPNSIVCLVDGDDYLLPHALQFVADAYANPNVAMTYGNVLVDFRPYQDTQQNYFWDKGFVNTEYPQEVWDRRSFREDGFRCFHLRTFRRWLWDYINPQEFKRPLGDFIHASGDSAFVFPMLELLGDRKHVAFIETPLYVYRLYEGNVHNYDKKSQSDDLEYLRFGLQKYDPLDRKVLQQHLINPTFKRVTKCVSEAQPNRSESNLNDEDHSREARPRRRGDLAKPQQASCRLLECRVNNQTRQLCVE